MAAIACHRRRLDVHAAAEIEVWGRRRTKRESTVLDRDEMQLLRWNGRMKGRKSSQREQTGRRRKNQALAVSPPVLVAQGVQRL